MILCLLGFLGLLQPATELYSLRAVVLNAEGVPIRDLRPADVSLIDRGATLSLTRFERDERPSRVALLVDSSGPMATAYRLHFVDAAKAFVASLPANTRLSVWLTGDRPTKVLDDLDLGGEGTARDVEASLRRTPAVGGNTVLDAVVEAAEDLRKEEGERKIVVVLSATGPGFSNDTRQSIVDRVGKTGVEVTGVLISDRGESAEGGDVSQVDYDYVFANLAAATGGRLERPLSVMAAGSALMKVAADLRATYRLAYEGRSGDDKPKLSLQVARPSARVRLSTPRKEGPTP